MSTRAWAETLRESATAGVAQNRPTLRRTHRDDADANSHTRKLRMRSCRKIGGPRMICASLGTAAEGRPDVGTEPGAGLPKNRIDQIMPIEQAGIGRKGPAI